MTFFLNLFSYLYLIDLLMKGEFTASLFVLYIGLIGSFSSYFSQLMDRLNGLNPICISLGYIREFLELEEEPGWSEGIGRERLAKLKKEGVRVELKGVSFSYPDQEQEALSDVNLTISSGEKLALIGLNGAGDAGETLLVREANADAIDFSGGEKQKLLFARALYKRAPLLILDEPTAALDPITENEMYIKFADAAENRTCVYISHRLSSTRFCDRIILMEHGRITEEGTHEELMKKGARYAQLFEVQSRYYKEQEARRRQSAAMDDVFAGLNDEKGVFYE